MKIVFSKRCIEYGFPGHPESPQRLTSAYSILKSKGFEFVEASPAKEEDILKAHTVSLLEKVRNIIFLDPDTPNSNQMYESALLSAGAAIQAQEIALKEGFAFSLMRPPGHHATKEAAGGFCYKERAKKTLMLASG